VPATTTKGRGSSRQTSRARAGAGRSRAQEGAGRFARHSTLPGPARPWRRPPKQQSTVQKAIGTVLPMLSAKKATPSSKKGKAGGLAVLAAAAAGAGALLRKRQGRGDGDMPPQPHSGTNSAGHTPAQEHGIDAAGV
jgi:hypothetical protein